MRRGSSKEEQDRKRFNRESGALFCDSINIMDHSGMLRMSVSCDHYVIM